MEVICLGKNRKITITARGNTISYCGCEDCKAQRSFDNARKKSKTSHKQRGAK